MNEKNRRCSNIFLLRKSKVGGVGKLLPTDRFCFWRLVGNGERKDASFKAPGSSSLRWCLQPRADGFCFSRAQEAGLILRNGGETGLSSF